MTQLSASLSLALFAGILSAWSAVAQSPDGSEVVRSKLAAELEQLITKDYRQDGAGLVGALKSNSTARVPRQLKAGVTYAIIGACGNNCTHVRLSLYDESGSLLIASPEAHSAVIISGTPSTPGTFRVELAVPGCLQETCEAGFIVTRLEQNDGKETSPSAKTAKANEPVKVAALPKVEKPVGTAYLDGTWIVTASSKTCQLRPDGSRTLTYPLKIANGSIDSVTQAGRRISGKVTGGVLRGRYLTSSDGVLMRFQATMGGNAGRGTFSRSDGKCDGVFTMRRG